MPKFLNAYQTDEKLTFLYRKEDTGQLMARTVTPEYVTYLRKADLDKTFIGEINRSASVRSTRIEGEWLRVAWRNWEARRHICGTDSPFAQRNIKIYEGDVSPIRRYATDNKIEIARPRRAYFDIEADSRTALSDKENSRILCWTIVGQDGEIISGLLDHDTDEDECRLLTEMWAALDDYDQIIAWYGDGYDFPVILARTKKLGVEVKDVRRWLFLDHLKVFKRMNVTSAESGEEKRSYALQAIAMAILGRGKTPLDSSKTWEAWVAGGESRRFLLKYNVDDTVLLRDIEEKTGYIELFQTLCEVCGIFPDSVSLNPTSQVDGYMLSLGLEHGIHYSTKLFSDEQQYDKFKGAFVLPVTAKGIAKNVHVGDFKSMYPSIIISWNMSPDTKRSDMPPNGPLPKGFCRAPTTGIVFDRSKPGILAIALSEILRLRVEWNDKRTACIPNTPEWKEADRRATAYKVAANTFYGVLGSPFSRYFDREIGESITQTGVWLIKATVDLATKWGMETVYGDTDSLFIRGATAERFREFIKYCNKEYYPKLIQETGVPVDAIKVEVAYEKEFARIVFTTKKRYCGRIAHYKGKAATKDSKPEIRGLEYRRGDYPVIAADLQLQAINALMRDECEDPAVFEEQIRAKLDYILCEQLAVEQIRISKSLDKNLSEYVLKQRADGKDHAGLPHILLARTLRDRKVIQVKRYREGYDVPKGTKIEYVVTDATASPCQVVWAPEYKGQLDRYYLWEKIVFPPTYRLLQAAFPEHNWAKFAKVRPPKRARVHESQMALLDMRSLNTPQTGLRNAPIVVITTAAPKPMPKFATASVPSMRRQRGGPLVIRLSDKHSEADLKILDALLDNSRGVRKVELHIMVGGAITELNLPYKISVTHQLLGQIKDLFGNDAV